MCQKNVSMGSGRTAGATTSGMTAGATTSGMTAGDVLIKDGLGDVVVNDGPGPKWEGRARVLVHSRARLSCFVLKHLC